MLGVSMAACKMSSRLLYQQLADVHRGQLQKCITCYLFCLFQQSYCDCICLCVYVCLWGFSFTLRLCKPVGCHTDAHKYVFTYATLQRRYEILTYSPLELMDSTNWCGHCSYIHTLPLTCTIYRYMQQQQTLTHLVMHLRWNVNGPVHCLGNGRLAGGGGSSTE